jgi:hypothetical protein
MNIAKDEKGYVVWWVDRKFMTDDTFPNKCLDVDSGKKTVNKKHLRAYKTWSTLPNKRKDISEWVNTWLDAEEKEALKKFVKKRKNDD